MKIKKIFFSLCLTIIVATSLSSQDKQNFSFYTDDLGFQKYTITPDKIIFEDEESKITKEYDRKDFQLNENGFYYLFGKVIIFQNNGDSFRPIDNLVFTDKNAENWFKSYIKNIEENNEYYNMYKFNTVYTASSELKEGTTIYSAKNLGTLFLPPDSKEGSRMWNPGHKPWVEGIAGYGENEFITISTSKEFNELNILNGFVSERLDLYKKNSRVKDFEIIDLDNNIQYSFTLLDEVRIQTFKMSQWTKNVKLIIKSVYKGDKWDDTCITSIIPELVY